MDYLQRVMGAVWSADSSSSTSLADSSSTSLAESSQYRRPAAPVRIVRTGTWAGSLSRVEKFGRHPSTSTKQVITPVGRFDPLNERILCPQCGIAFSPTYYCNVHREACQWEEYE